MTVPSTFATEHLDDLLRLIRTGEATTLAQLVDTLGLGRTVVTQRIATLVEAGLIRNGPNAPSTGGRPSRTLTFAADAGTCLVAELGATSITVALTDLGGTIIAEDYADSDIATGPDASLEHVESMFDALLAQHPGVTVWGIGIGVPGPVEFRSGYPISPPIMPGWDHYPVRERLASRYRAPVWVDNDVNLLALGELADGQMTRDDIGIYVKVGSGIGSGLVDRGRLHRGAQGAAGDIGHIAVLGDVDVTCRCGKRGCLESMAGGMAIARQGRDAAESGASDLLHTMLSERSDISAQDVSEAASHGDPSANTIINAAGRRIGEVIAALVNFYNPSVVVVGGGVAQSGDMFLASIRQSIYQRSLPLATRDIRIVRSNLGERGGIIGASELVIQQLLTAPHLDRLLADRLARAQEAATS